MKGGRECQKAFPNGSNGARSRRQISWDCTWLWDHQVFPAWPQAEQQQWLPPLFYPSSDGAVAEGHSECCPCWQLVSAWLCLPA